MSAEIKKRTCRKSAENRAVSKMVSMKPEIWKKADMIADDLGTTRSAVCAKAIEEFWEKTKGADK